MASRAELEHVNRRLAAVLDDYLKRQHGKRTGFALFVFDFGEKGNLAYISNSDRPGMIAAVKEWLARAEAGLDTDPPGPWVEG